MASTALGIRPHTGWAVVVVVSGAPAVEVVARRRIDLVPEDDLRFCWHASQLEGRSPKEATAFARRVAKLAGAAASRELRAILEAVAAAGHEAVAAGIVGEPRDLPGAAEILARHTLLHSAEGEVFREALAVAAAGLGLEVTHVHPKAAVLGDRLAGHPGRPWAADHRAAAAAALDALAAR